MKKERLIQQAIFTTLLIMVGILIYGAFLYRDQQESSGFGYGNLWLQYSIRDRGIRGHQVEWLIATPEMPVHQTFQGNKNLWTYHFKNGNSFSFHPNSESLTWVDPVKGPKKISIELSRELILRIEETQAVGGEKKFRNGKDLVFWLERIRSEPSLTEQSPDE